MFGMLWPVILALAGTTAYQICAKETAEDVHPFASLTIAYVVAMLISLVLFFVFGNNNLVQEIGKANWASWALGFSVLFMELGYIFLYRANWKISVASLVANISGAIFLLIIGIFLYEELLSIRQFVGITVCFIGLILVNLPAKGQER